MNFLSQWRIGRRLAVAFGVVVALTLASAGFTQLRLVDVSRLSRELTTEQNERLALSYHWKNNIEVNSGRAVLMGMMTDTTFIASEMEKSKATSVDTTAVQKRFAELETTAQGKALMASIADVRTRWLAQRDVMLKANDGTSSIAAAIAKGNAVKEFNGIVDAYMAAANQLVAYETSRAKADGAAIDDALAMTRLVGGVCTLVCALFSIGLGLAITRSIVRPVQAAQHAADRIAAGDLTGACRAEGTDEAAQLVKSLATMQDALKRIVREIRNSTEQIQVASTEVASGNQDLSARTEQTTGNLQQAASSMDELTSTMRHSADAATQAHGLAHSASEIAARGGQVVSQVVSTMDEINSSSKKISDIIGVIDGIAFQTNILALNAAVEAARAGEQGRGFAVVAGEVRSLAQRSAEAAKEIKSLIGTSVDKVETGARLVQDAGSTMQEIVQAVRRVSEVLGEITTAASEQAGGIQLVNEAVNNVDQMTQQNAALVEQSAAAAESMKDQAGKLARAVEQFRTN
ncbi:MAG: methyl-accepting chemotaxis protein [Burkholderiaceae bacterium]